MSAMHIQTKSLKLVPLTLEEVRAMVEAMGLFHSVYSTEYYELKAIPLSMRDEVRQMIGDEAESLPIDGSFGLE